MYIFLSLVHVKFNTILGAVSFELLKYKVSID